MYIWGEIWGRVGERRYPKCHLKVCVLLPKNEEKFALLFLVLLFVGKHDVVFWGKYIYIVSPVIKWLYYVRDRRKNVLLLIIYTFFLFCVILLVVLMSGIGILIKVVYKERQYCIWSLIFVYGSLLAAKLYVEFMELFYENVVEYLYPSMVLTYFGCWNIHLSILSI